MSIYPNVTEQVMINSAAQQNIQKAFKIKKLKQTHDKKLAESFTPK